MYTQPLDLKEALLVLMNSDPKVIAGGTDVYPALKPGLCPSEFLDVSRIRGLKEISQDGKGVRIGAAATWSDIVNANLPAAFDALKQAAREVGSIQIQNAGTIAGNICNASPAADGVPPLLALDAKVELCSKENGTRILPLSEFITGVRQTLLMSDELVTAVLVPQTPDRMGSAFEKLGSRRYLVISITMTAANVLLGRDGRIEDVRIAVGSCSAVAQRLHALEEDLKGTTPQDVVVTKHHLKPLAPIDDVRGSGAYRLAAVQEQIQRAVMGASQR
jgi:CO/xanthine dehydrogenase FAD-binding subunit